MSYVHAVTVQSGDIWARTLATSIIRTTTLPIVFIAISTLSKYYGQLERQW